MNLAFPPPSGLPWSTLQTGATQVRQFMRGVNRTSRSTPSIFPTFPSSPSPALLIHLHRYRQGGTIHVALDGSRSAAPVVSGCDQKPPKRTPRGADVLGTRGQENYDGGCPCESASGFRISVGWSVGRSCVLGVASPRLGLARALSSGLSAFHGRI